MRFWRLIAVLLGLLLVSWIVMVLIGVRPDPKDLTYWLQASRTRDWSIEATQGNSEAQFLHGLSLIRTNLIIMIDRIPYLSAIPVVGQRFETVTCQIDNTIDRQRLEEAHRWIEESAAKSYAPAIEAKKLFFGRIPKSDESPGNSGASREGPTRH